MRAFTVFQWLFEASIGALVLVCLILPVRQLLRGKLGSKLIYALWLLVILRLLIPLRVPNPLLSVYPEYSENVIERVENVTRNVARDIADTVAYAALEQPYERITPLHMAAYEAMQPNYSGYVWLGGYLLGVLAVGGVMVYQNARFRRYLRRHSLGELDGGSAERYDALAKRLGVRAPKALLVDPLDSACLVGGLRPLIALPATSAGDGYIQLHELCHLKGGDALWGLLRNVCCALFWFHPLVWLAARLSRSDCELACDQRVTERLSPDEKIGYAELLVSLAACRRTPRMGVLATGMSMTGTRMKRRVRQILANHRLRLWAVVVAALVSLTALATCFATATVYPEEITAPFIADEPVEQDAWLIRDAAKYYPQGDFNAYPRENTSVTTRLGAGTFLTDWTYGSGFKLAASGIAPAAKPKWPFTHDYSRMSSDAVSVHTAIPFDEKTAAEKLACYTIYSAVYDGDNRLLCVVRQPLLSGLNLRLWERSSGETLYEVEYDVRENEEAQRYRAWAEANREDYTDAAAAACTLAEQIGWDGVEVIRTQYQMALDVAEPVPLQHVTLRVDGGREITFSVEMGTWRVLAVSFSDDLVNGIAAEAERLSQSPEQSGGVGPKLTSDAAFIRQKGLEALGLYLDYAPGAVDDITVGETSWAYNGKNWWEVCVTVAGKNLRYRADINDDGTVRRVSRTPCNITFTDAYTSYGGLDQGRISDEFNLSPKTVFWLCGGALMDTPQAYPPEVIAAQARVDAFIQEKQLPVGEQIEFVLYVNTRRQLKRETDVGLEFSFDYQSVADGQVRQAYIFYSTIQQDIGYVDFYPEDDAA